MPGVLGFLGAYPWLLVPCICALALGLGGVAFSSFNAHTRLAILSGLTFVAGLVFLVLWVAYQDSYSDRQERLQEAACHQVLDDFQSGLVEAGVSSWAAAIYLQSLGPHSGLLADKKIIGAIESQGCPLSVLRDIAWEWAPPVPDFEADWPGILLESLERTS